MTLQATIAKLLGKRNELTSAQCDVQIEKIGERLKEIRATCADIDSDTNTAGKFTGSTRQRIAETGTPAALIKLDAELELLEAEDISLCVQRDALRRRKEKAVIEEAPGRVKAAIKKLAPALKAAETASAAKITAIAALEAVKDEIISARRTAIHGGIKSPIVKTDNFERLAALLEWVWIPPAPVFEVNLNRLLRIRRHELCDNEAPAGTIPDPGPAA